MPPNNLAPVGLTKDEFVKRYWFGSLQMVTVRNPQDKDHVFTVEMRHYMIPANGEESFVGPIANVYLDRMAKFIAQDEDKLALIADYSFKAHYYDDLIVNVKDLAPEYNPVPDWQQRMQDQSKELPPWMQGGQKPQTSVATPPWEQAPNMESARAVAPNAPDYVPPATEPETKPEKEEVKEFEADGMKYRLTIDKNGGRVYFRDGKRTDAATYAKAASML